MTQTHIGNKIFEKVSKAIHDKSALKDAVRLLSSLRESFEELSKQDTSGPAMSNTQSVYAGLTYGKGTLNESTSFSSDNRGYTV